MELALEQGTKEWLAMRKEHVMASDAPVIMRVSPWRTPHQLWKEKIGLGEGQKENAAMKYGRDNEHRARLLYQSQTGFRVDPKVVFHHTKKFMGASLDGWSSKGNMAVEIKCPGLVDHNTAKEGKIPEKYKPQLQHQLACLDCEKIHYFSFRENEGILVEVEYDEDYINDLYDQESIFWDKVLNLVAPSMIPKDFKDMGTSQEWQEIAERMIERQPKLKSLTEEDKTDRALLIQMAGKCSAVGHGVKASKIVRKGSVNYKSIPELIGVDLEEYRKNPIETWRLDISLRIDRSLRM